MSFFLISSFDESKDLFAIDLASALVDDGIADLSDQNNKSWWSVVILRVSPNQQNGVHHWNE